MWETIATQLISGILKDCLDKEEVSGDVMTQATKPQGRLMRRIAVRKATRQAGLRFGDLCAEDRVKYLDFVRNGISPEEADTVFDLEEDD